MYGKNSIFAYVSKKIGQETAAILFNQEIELIKIHISILTNEGIFVAIYNTISHLNPGIQMSSNFQRMRRLLKRHSALIT